MGDHVITLPRPAAAESGVPAPIWLGSAEPRIDTKALVRGLILPESMIVTYGESGSGKTAHVLDRDIHTAAGAPWHGRECAGPAIVAYVAAEGPHSVINRAAALRLERFSGPEIDSPPFAILPYSPDMLSADTDAVLLVDALKRISDDHQLPVVKVTLDTLSRVMAGGNENAPDDMTAVIRHADMIRARMGCAVELVHHAGKDNARGARGHSSLRAATDTEIEVTNREGYCVAKVTKQRDLPTGDEFAYRLRAVELGTDAYGYPVTTVIPDPILDHKPIAPEKRLPDQAKRLLWQLGEGIEFKGELPPREVLKGAERPPSMGQKGMSGPALRAWVEERGGISEADNPDTRERAVRRHLQTLQAKGFIHVFMDFVWLADKPDKHRTS